MRRAGRAALVAVMVGLAPGAVAQSPSAEAGLVTVESAHSARETVNRFATAVRSKGWMVFTEIDHAAAAQTVGQTLAIRTVILFGNPNTGTPAMANAPTLALDLPLRVLVWQDDVGRIFMTRSTGADSAMRIFARHNVVVPAAAVRATEATLEALVRAAVE